MKVILDGSNFYSQDILMLKGTEIEVKYIFAESIQGVIIKTDSNFYKVGQQIVIQDVRCLHKKEKEIKTNMSRIKKIMED